MHVLKYVLCARRVSNSRVRNVYNFLFVHALKHFVLVQLKPTGMHILFSSRDLEDTSLQRNVQSNHLGSHLNVCVHEPAFPRVRLGINKTP